MDDPVPVVATQGPQVAWTSDAPPQPQPTLGTSEPLGREQRADPECKPRVSPAVYLPTAADILPQRRRSSTYRTTEEWFRSWERTVYGAKPKRRLGPRKKKRLSVRSMMAAAQERSVLMTSNQIQEGVPLHPVRFPNHIPAAPPP
eukprot:Hpha_TRINITY_DN26665_c0_g1::TRINITY_DN26665_c0_g1_i1::g.86061::m.86061